VGVGISGYFPVLWSRSQSQSQGAEIKWPPEAGAEITNCCSSSGCNSFSLIKDLKKFYRKKIMVAGEVFVNGGQF
jgi:hypothetical protein